MAYGLQYKCANNNEWNISRMMSFDLDQAKMFADDFVKYSQNIVAARVTESKDGLTVPVYEVSKSDVAKQSS